MSIDPLKLIVGGALIVAGTLIPGAQFLQPVGVAMVIGSVSISSGDKGARLAARQAGTLISNAQRTDVPLPVVYGTAKLGVAICDKRVDEVSTDNEDFWMPVFICHGSRDGLGIEAIQDVWFNDQRALDSAGAIQSPFSASTLAFAKLLGTTSQSFASASVGGSNMDTQFADWASTDKGAGLAGLMLKLIDDKEVYTQGVPIVTVKVRGNLVEDNRSEVSGVNITFATAGDTITRASGNFVTDGYAVGERVDVSGSASNNGSKTINAVAATVLTVDENLTNEGPVGGVTLKRWAQPNTGGDNPYLCARDYLLSTIYGPGRPASEIDEASFNAMANYCDETVSVPDDASGSRNQKRYTCNGWLSTQRTVRQNLDELLSSCRGNIIFEGGKWRAFTTRSVTPSSIALSEDNIIGGMEFTNAGNDEKINVARATIIDPAKNYQPDTVQWPNAGAANAFLTEDNNFEKRLELDLPFTNEDHMAENILDITLSESRQGIRVVLTATEEALQYQIGDVVPVTHSTPGWTAKNFWVMGIGLTQSSAVRLALVEYDATSYTHGTQSDATQEPDTNLPDPFTITAPTGLTLTDQLGQTQTGQSMPEILVTWTDTAEAFIDRYEVQAKKNSDTEWQNYGSEEQGVQTHFVRPVPVEPGDVLWDVRIKAVNTLGAVSTWVSGQVTVNLYDRFVQWLAERETQDRVIGFPRDTPGDALAICTFETGSGTTARNHVPSTDDFTITTGAGSAWVEGPAGGAYDFNETAFARATSATAFDIGLTTAFTIDVICRWDANAAAPQELVQHDNDYVLELTNVGVLQYLTRDNWAVHTPGVDLSSAGLNLQGKWIHIHWEYNGADESKFYINGVLRATHTASAAASGTAIGDNLDIGGFGATQRFNGAIAYVRVVKGVRKTFPYLADVLSQVPTELTPEVTSLEMLLDETDGSMLVRVEVNGDVGSIRHVNAVGTPASWPTDANVEAGTIVNGAGPFDITLAASTLDPLETIRLRVVPYINTGGVGPANATQHGPIADQERAWRPQRGAITHKIRIPYAEVFPFGDTTNWSTAVDPAYLNQSVVGVTQIYTVSIVMPPGVTMTQASLRGYRNDTLDVVTASLNRLSDTGALTAIVLLTHDAASGWQTKSATISEVVSETSVYVALISLKVSSGGNVNDARFLWFEITYDRNDDVNDSY